MGRPIRLTLLVAGCAGGSPEPSDPLAPWPTDPAALVEVCGHQAYAELEITCRVQAASVLGARGESEAAATQCALVPTGTWREECHFRAGEELGRAGHTVEALRHCGQAGWFGRNCLTHAGWRLPRDPGLDSSVPSEQVASAGLELMGQVDQVLAGAGDGLPGEGRDIVMARFGYNLYVGSGLAQPEPAHLDDPLGAVLRTGFAIEAARLISAEGPPTVEGLVSIWSGNRAPPRGDPLLEHTRIGRYSPPIQSPHEQGLPHLPVYGGGLRLVGQSPEEDLVIAALEALFWLPEVDVAVFLSHLDDPRPRVRWTAARLFRLDRSATTDMQSTLQALAEQHPDENVRWHASHALQHETWVPPGRAGRP